MRILFLDAYFTPEQIAFTHLENDLLEGLVNEGHEVEIICPTPTRGVTKETIKRYRKKKEEFFYNGHVHVTRFWAPQERSNPIIRALRYLWCNFRTYQIGSHMNDINAIFANSTPPTQGLIAGFVRNRLNTRRKDCRVRFIYDLCDVFPDSLVNSGLTTRKSLLYRLGRKIENHTYDNADYIIAISESNRNNIIQKGVTPDKCSVIPDWIDTETTKPVLKKDNDLYHRFGLDPAKFTVVYAGNMGEAQGVDVVIESAVMLKEETIQFVLFGGGAHYQNIVRHVSELKLENVFVHKLLPLEEVAKVYSLGDIALITCKKGTGTAGMPSKAWSIMACNTYIVASFDLNSELECILKASNAGTTVQPEDSVKLKEEIYNQYKEWQNCGKKVINAREFVNRTRSRELCVSKCVNIITGAE